MVAECIDIKRECYFAIVMDRAAGGPIMIASKRGGMNIEEVRMMVMMMMVVMMMIVKHRGDDDDDDDDE